jgi:hypothetical protein
MALQIELIRVVIKSLRYALGNLIFKYALTIPLFGDSISPLSFRSLRCGASACMVKFSGEFTGCSAAIQLASQTLEPKVLNNDGTVFYR